MDNTHSIFRCQTDAHGGIEAVLIFRRDQLLYDIANYAYIEGHVLATDDTHQQHTLQDVVEDGNRDRISRILDLTFAQTKELLYPYTKQEVTDPALDNILKEPSTYGIVLSLPSGFSQTTLHLMERLIHEYVVCYALADWLSITNTQKAEVWAAKAADMQSQIRSAIVNRSHRVRRRMTLFP